MTPPALARCPIWEAAKVDFDDRANFKYAWPKSINFKRWPETIYALEVRYQPSNLPGWDADGKEIEREKYNPLTIVKYDPKEKMVRFSSLADFLLSTFGGGKRLVPHGRENFALRSASSMTASTSRRGLGNVLITAPNPAFDLDILDMGGPYYWWAEVEGLAPNQALSIYSGQPSDQGFWFVGNDDGSVDVVMNEANGDRYGYLMEIEFTK